MPRASSADFCLLCSQAPCICGKPKKTTKPRKAAPKAAPPPVPAEDPVVFEEKPPVRQSMVERMRARASAAPPVPVVRKRAVPVVRPVEEIDPQLIQAVRLFSEAFEINPEDLEPFKSYLDKPPSVRERAAAWKQRRTADET